MTTSLNEAIDQVAVLIDGATQLVLLTAELDEHFVDVPGNAWPAFAPFQ